MFDLRIAVSVTVLMWLTALGIHNAHAQSGNLADNSLSSRIRPPVGLDSSLLGREVGRVEIVTDGRRWRTDESLPKQLLNRPLTPEYARRVMRHLLATGRYAEVKAEAETWGESVVLRFNVLPRRVVSQIDVTGAKLGRTATLEAAEIEVGDEVTVHSLKEIDQRVMGVYRDRGFPHVAVATQAIDTDDAMGIVLIVGIRPGQEAHLAARRFELDRQQSARLQTLLRDYEVDDGDRADRVSIDAANATLTEELRANHFPNASVSHHIDETPEGLVLTVDVKTKAETHLSFEGNAHFDDDTLRTYLRSKLEGNSGSRSTSELLRNYYVQRGFLDAKVERTARRLKRPREDHSIFTVREGPRVKVRGRLFPCLTGDRTAGDIADEVDSFLSESLPASPLFGSVDPNDMDLRLGSGRPARRRATPLQLDPYTTYHPETYGRALKHLTSLYRSEGYLSAQAGPVHVIRNTCLPHSPAGECFVAPRQSESVDCGRPHASEQTAPTSSSESTSALRQQCIPDSGRGIRCADELVLEIPMRLGAQAVLWDLDFSGNQHLVERELAEATEIALGEPVSQLQLEEARRRLIHRYEDDGYAYAGVEVELQLSPDQSRARALFHISERQPVVVSDIVVRGARFTSEPVIRARVALQTGQPYRRTSARSTEDQLISLGAFTSVTVGLEDPEVPSRDKVVVIDVQERLPQYLDVRPGFSNGQGLRLSFNYGHRNLFNRAIHLLFQLQLGYLPPQFILGNEESDRFEQLQDQEALQFLLQHRLSLTLGLPDVGLGPAYRLDLEGLNVRDIFPKFARDKSALIGTLSRRTNRRFRVFAGASLELNEVDLYASILDGTQFDQALETLLTDTNQTNPAWRAMLNVPQGLTFVVAQRMGFSWDRRDDPVSATKGTLLNFNIEHVDAYPIESQPRGGAAATGLLGFESHFLRYSGRFATYVPLGWHGITLATSLHVGWNQQLVSSSETYPDRFFFLGGTDSMRGYTPRTILPADVLDERDNRRASSIPQTEDDIPDDSPPSGSSLSETQTNYITAELIPGGNLLINPRAELRIPLFGIWQTVIFVDSGNLWVNANAAWESFALRYTGGTGVRFSTPVGPLAVDIGINRIPKFTGKESNDWWRLHFSIGLY